MKTFKVKDKEYRVNEPSVKNRNEARKVWNEAYSASLKSGAILRVQLNDIMKEKGVWDEKREADYAVLQEQLRKDEKILDEGGIKLIEAKSISMRMRDTRNEMIGMLGERSQLENNTAEGQANNAMFDCLVQQCLVYNKNGAPVYLTLDDYLNKADDDVAMQGARELSGLIYDVSNDVEKELPENEFLTEFEFIDDKLRLIDEDGHLISRDGKLIDEEGRYVDKDGNYVNLDGEKVDKKGKPLKKRKPFLGEDGEKVLSKVETAKELAEEGAAAKAAEKEKPVEKEESEKPAEQDSNTPQNE